MAALAAPPIGGRRPTRASLTCSSSTSGPSSSSHIRDLHVAKTVEDIGFYGGFVGASYMLGRALTSTVWGMVADRIGRKPVIVFGIFSMLVFNTLFGLSTNYWMAITSRFLVGSLTALLGPMRAYTNEICRPEHQAIGMSLDSTSWAVGLIIGPAIGGYLAQVSIVTCCFILQNNSVNQDQRATADGLATTIMSVFKACAPAGAGIVFSWAQRRQHAFFFPGDQMLFFLLVVVEFLGLVWTFKPFLAIPEKFPQN